ncbi:alpha/beta hydrolase [Mammaliicoccus sciuri]|uniref:alpha/beta hydrolase n=1 Tax=Mammaliicoccus sciuri TaxID=1296 RepID=UPI003F55F5F1
MLDLKLNLITIDNINFEYIEKGREHTEAILFLHGWPTNCHEFDKVMNILSTNFHVISLNIPGIGENPNHLPNYSKDFIATLVSSFVEQLSLSNICLVGTDLGGQIAYSVAKNDTECITKIIMMNIAIPGVYPWNKVITNPWIWHFSFHAVAELPEKIISGNEEAYLNFFYNALTIIPLDKDYKNSFIQTYKNGISLKSGFEYYRSFYNDSQNNIENKSKVVNKPTLYLRGKEDAKNMEDYEKGFLENNFTNIRFDTITNSKHFSSLENALETAKKIKIFMNNN